MADEKLAPQGAYVYAILVDGVVRYIGKGRGKRVRMHAQEVRSIMRRRAAGETIRTRHFYNRLALALAGGGVVQEVILVDGLTDGAAFEREIAEIAAAPDGQLWNTLSGGNGWTSEQAKAVWNDPGYRENISAKLKECHSRPEMIESNRQRSSSLWSDSEYLRKVRKGRRNIYTDERRAVMSAKAKETWTKPDFRAARVKRLRELAVDPDCRALQIAAVKARWQDPEYRRNHIEKVKAKWANPEWRAEMVDKIRRGKAKKAAR